jgi:RNA polymerase sigma-70 factor (ECF subfamily)
MLATTPGAAHRWGFYDHAPIPPGATSSLPHLAGRRDAIARAKAGDRDGLRTLYAHYANNVYGYVRSIVRDDHEAEDITQHVFLKLMTNIVKYEERGGPFSAWLLRLARNAAIDYLRANRSTPTADVFEGDRPTVQDHAALEDVKLAFEQLPAPQREVVFLRHVVGLSPKEIATRIGRSECSVHGLCHRGRRAFQRELTELDLVPHTRTKRSAVAA